MAIADLPRKKELDGLLASLVGSSRTIEVLTILTEKEASPKEIASELGMTTPAASHHVRKLAKLRLVELVEERDVGGVIQHFYRAVVRPFVSNDEWRKLSLDERRRVSAWIFQLIVADAARSFDAALFDSPANNHLSRTVLLLDRQGFDELAEIQDRALEESFAVQARSAERLAAGQTEGAADVVSAMMCFQVPRGVSWVKMQEVSSAMPATSIRKSN